MARRSSRSSRPKARKPRTRNTLARPPRFSPRPQPTSVSLESRRSRIALPSNRVRLGGSQRTRGGRIRTDRPPPRPIGDGRRIGIRPPSPIGRGDRGIGIPRPQPKPFFPATRGDVVRISGRTRSGSREIGSIQPTFFTDLGSNRVSVSSPSGRKRKPITVSIRSKLSGRARGRVAKPKRLKGHKRTTPKRKVRPPLKVTGLGRVAVKKAIARASLKKKLKTKARGRRVGRNVTPRTPRRIGRRPSGDFGSDFNIFRVGATATVAPRQTSRLAPREPFRTVRVRTTRRPRPIGGRRRRAPIRRRPIDPQRRRGSDFDIFRV